MLDKDTNPVSRPDRRSDFDKGDRAKNEEAVGQRKNPPEDQKKFEQLIGKGPTQARPKKPKSIFDLSTKDVPKKGKPEVAFDKKDKPEVAVGKKELSTEADTGKPVVLPDAPTPLAAAVTSVAKSESGTHIPEIKDLANYIGDKIVQVRDSGQTDTVVTIKHPAIFEGATVKLTEHASAKGEYNVTFGNLPQDAKAILDIGGNQDALRTAMDAKGFPLHIITTKSESDVIRGSGEHTTDAEDRDEEAREQKRQR